MKNAVIVLSIVAVLGLVPEINAFYNPSTGRWLSRDPIGERGGRNLYGFVRNNPLSRIDLLGLRPGFCPCKDNQKKADDFVNKAIQDAMAGATTPDQIAQKIRTLLIGGGSGVFSIITGIEKIIEDAVDANKIEGVRCPCNSKANIIIRHAVPQSAASISLCGQCIGSDKLGHFFEEGLTYYDIKKAHGQAYADAFGRWLEGLTTPGMDQAMYDFLDGVHFINYGDSGLLFARGASYGYFGDRGLDPSGLDASPADLAANRSGQDFWENLYTGKVDPAKFNICDYVKKEWDQTKNPNIAQDPKPSRPNR